jgi:hydrogenase/urease accessory protein HupE
MTRLSNPADAARRGARPTGPWRVAPWPRAQRSGLARLASFCLLALVLLSTRRSSAHSIGLSRGEYRALPDGVEAELVFDRDELAGVLDERTGKGLESSAGRAELERRIVRRVRVTDRSGQRCPGTLRGLTTTSDGGARIDAVYLCPRGPATSHVAIEFWDELSPGHRHLARSRNDAGPSDADPSNARERLLYLAQPSFELTPLSHPPSLSPVDWVRLGVEHILGGYDHLLFLLALALVTPALRTLAATVSVFTLAHSVTLALSTLQVFSPPPSLVECAIALSISYVGLENLTARASKPRYLLVFAFGLIHGFGFASALAELGLPQAQSLGALFSFNVGVELGQLAVLAVAFPVIQQFRRTAWFGPRGVPALSLGTALAGVLWFFDRV